RDRLAPDALRRGSDLLVDDGRVRGLRSRPRGGLRALARGGPRHSPSVRGVPVRVLRGARWLPVAGSSVPPGLAARGAGELRGDGTGRGRVDRLGGCRVRRGDGPPLPEW